MTRAGLIATVLAGLHLLVLLAGFAAPYDPVEQTRTLPFAPPSRLHVVDADGAFHLRPFVYALAPDPDTGMLCFSEKGLDAWLERRSDRVAHKFRIWRDKQVIEPYRRRRELEAMQSDVG
jgi:hypothetical protein